MIGPVCKGIVGSPRIFHRIWCGCHISSVGRSTGMEATRPVINRPWQCECKSLNNHGEITTNKINQGKHIVLYFEIAVPDPCVTTWLMIWKLPDILTLMSSFGRESVAKPLCTYFNFLIILTSMWNLKTTSESYTKRLAKSLDRKLY